MKPTHYEVFRHLQGFVNELSMMLDIVEREHDNGDLEIGQFKPFIDSLIAHDDLLLKRVQRSFERFSYWQMNMPCPPKE